MVKLLAQREKGREPEKSLVERESRSGPRTDHCGVCKWTQKEQLLQF